MEFTRIELLQRLHFEKIGASYRAQYGDYYSQAYRSRFINAPLCEGVDRAPSGCATAMLRHSGFIDQNLGQHWPGLF